MLKLFILLALIYLTGCHASSATDPQPGNTPQAIVRKPLLTAVMANHKDVQRVEIKQIDFKPGQQTGLHLHPCPVVGYIVSGSIFFQVDGEPAKVLKAGDAFYEPANTRMLHFDAQDEPATFITFYLMGESDHDVIHMLQ